MSADRISKAIWHSPWTPFALGVLTFQLFFVQRGWQRWGFVAVSVLFMIQFVDMADKRWGKR